MSSPIGFAKGADRHEVLGDFYQNIFRFSHKCDHFALIPRSFHTISTAKNSGFSTKSRVHFRRAVPLFSREDAKARSDGSKFFPSSSHSKKHRFARFSNTKLSKIDCHPGP
jgi:hypothetical protein